MTIITSLTLSIFISVIIFLPDILTSSSLEYSIIILILIALLDYIVFKKYNKKQESFILCVLKDELLLVPLSKYNKLDFNRIITYNNENKLRLNKISEYNNSRKLIFKIDDKSYVNKISGNNVFDEIKPNILSIKIDDIFK